MTNTQTERTMIEERIANIEEKIIMINKKYGKLLDEASIEAREKIANIEAVQGKNLAQFVNNLKTKPYTESDSESVGFKAKKVQKEIKQLFKAKKKIISQNLKNQTNNSKKQIKQIRNQFNFELQPELKIIKEQKKKLKQLNSLQ